MDTTSLPRKAGTVYTTFEKFNSKCTSGQKKQITHNSTQRKPPMNAV